VRGINRVRVKLNYPVFIFTLTPFILQVDEETRVLLSWGMKVLGYGASFIGGVVTATWIVAS